MDGIECLWMGGGTSKGAYFLASDQPSDVAERDALLLRIMGSPDPVQIDGIGGADPLTSKVAVLAPPSRPDADVDYLFLQVFVDKPIVTDAQNCGNILAGIGPFAIERGLISAQDGTTPVSIFMENTDQVAVAQVPTPGGQIDYRGDARIDGVPGTSGPIPITSGAQPEIAVLLIRANGVSSCSVANSSLQIKTNAAPSVSGDDVPAVIVPFSSNANFKPSKTS